MTKPSKIIGLVISSLAMVLASTRGEAQTPTPGTYRVWLCAEACAPSDSSRAIAVATVVILNDRTAVDDSVRSVFATLRPMGYTSETGANDNVCFSVIRRATRVSAEELFFGIRPRGRTHWTYSITDGFSVLVYQSPDAGYSLRWAEWGPLARGEGWSFGWSGNTPYHRNAYFAARRIGEPNVTQCT
jgi:hypothetical protein